MLKAYCSHPNQLSIHKLSKTKNTLFLQLIIYNRIENIMNQPSLNTVANSINQDQQSELSEQIIELQTSMAHLELIIERLDKVVTSQDQHIQTLQRQMQMLYKQIESQTHLEDSIAPFDVLEDRPPHY